MRQPLEQRDGPVRGEQEQRVRRLREGHRGDVLRGVEGRHLVDARGYAAACVGRVGAAVDVDDQRRRRAAGHRELAVVKLVRAADVGEDDAVGGGKPVRGGAGDGGGDPQRDADDGALHVEDDALVLEEADIARAELQHVGLRRREHERHKDRVRIAVLDGRHVERAAALARAALRQHHHVGEFARAVLVLGKVDPPVDARGYFASREVGQDAVDGAHHTSDRRACSHVDSGMMSGEPSMASANLASADISAKAC